MRSGELSQPAIKKTMAKRILSHDARTAANDADCSELRHGSHDEVEGFNAERQILNDDDDVNDDDNNEERNDDDDEAADGICNDDDDDECSSAGNASKFLTAINDARTSTPKMERHVPQDQRSYSFRDVEDSIEPFGAEDRQDVKDWMLQFEAMSKTAN